LEIDWISKYWLFSTVLAFLLFFRQCERLLLANFNFQPEELFPVNQTLRRYLLYIRENSLRLYESFTVIKVILFSTLAFCIIKIAFDFSFGSALNFSIVLAVLIISVSAFIAAFGYEFKKEPIRITLVRVFTLPAYLIGIIISPLVELLNELLFLFDKTLFKNRLEQDQNKTAYYFWGDKIKDDIPNDNESDLIDGIVSFKEISVKEVMTPRADIVAISADTNFQEVLELINSTHHSRIPLYEEDLDNITGIIYAKDLLTFLNNNEKTRNIDLAKAARKALYIPETKMIQDLLREFQDKKMHIAIVIDEFGGTSGLITLEDIIEEIVGEIRDELDVEENEIIKIDSNKFIVLGKVSIEELNESMNIEIPVDEGYDSIGGFILNRAGEVPKEGYSFKYQNTILTVKEITNKRIKKVQLEKINN
jgi:putative hemolysin